MFKKFMNMFEKHPGFAAGVLIMLIYVAACLVSWAITCGLIWLVTLCFGWEFKLSIATGIWLLMFLARSVFNHTTTVKK